MGRQTATLWTMNITRGSLDFLCSITLEIEEVGVLEVSSEFQCILTEMNTYLLTLCDRVLDSLVV